MLFNEPFYECQTETLIVAPAEFKAAKMRRQGAKRVLGFLICSHSGLQGGYFLSGSFLLKQQSVGIGAKDQSDGSSIMGADGQI